MKLEDLRKNIDDIDDRIFDLLRQRLGFVEQVGNLKRSNSTSQYIIRSGREALKVKKAWQQAKEAGFDDKISKAIASIWREIIALSINFEEPVKIAYNAAKSKDTYWLIREYFGAYSDMKSYKLDKEIIQTLSDNRSNVAALVAERNTGFEPWWLLLSKTSGLSVFASLPLFPLKKHAVENADMTTFLISNVTPEPTGEDKFLYVITKPLPESEVDNFEIVSEYKGNFLVSSDEFYNNYQDKLGAKYLGCYATFDF